jgi:prevent-host-death family protein
MKVINATAARANFFNLIDQVAEEHEEVMITTKRNNAVLVSEEDWRSIQETIYLSSIPGVRESILEAAKTPDEEFLSEEEFMQLLNEGEAD